MEEHLLNTMHGAQQGLMISVNTNNLNGRRRAKQRRVTGKRRRRCRKSSGGRGEELLIAERRRAERVGAERVSTHVWWRHETWPKRISKLRRERGTGCKTRVSKWRRNLWRSQSGKQQFPSGVRSTSGQNFESRSNDWTRIGHWSRRHRFRRFRITFCRRRRRWRRRKRWRTSNRRFWATPLTFNDHCAVVVVIVGVVFCGYDRRRQRRHVWGQRRSTFEKLVSALTGRRRRRVRDFDLNRSRSWPRFEPFTSGSTAWLCPRAVVRRNWFSVLVGRFVSFPGMCVSGSWLSWRGCLAVG